jgi:hypothetical protein
MSRLAVLRRFLDTEVADWLQNSRLEGLWWILWIVMAALAAALLLAILNGT